MNTVVYVIANIFRVFLICRFARMFFDQDKETKKKEWLWCGIFFVINTVTYLEFHLAWLNLLSHLLGITILTLIYTKEWKMNLFVTTMITIVVIICDVLSTIPFVEYVDGETVNTISFVLVDFTLLVYELLIERIIDVKKRKNETHKLPLIIVPLCSIFVILFMVYHSKNLNVDFVVVCCALLVINFLVLYLYNKLVEIMEQLYENKLLIEKAEMYRTQLEVIKQSEEKVKLLRHDMRHHLTELNILAVKDKNIEIQNYISNMYEFVKNPYEIVSSGNMEMDSLMNYLLMKAKQELKEVNINVSIPENIENIFDVNIVLGNLLENAIEAASSTTEKILNVKLTMKQGVLKIEIENSYNGDLSITSKGLVTTKKDKHNHGLGLKSVKRIIKKYNGAMELYTDEMFRVKVILYI